MRNFRRKQNRFPHETGFSKFMVFLLTVMLTVFQVLPAEAASVLGQPDRDIVVVIDPGHGGDNEGTKENGFCEKEMTLVTAQALCDRLSQYDGVQVYMTRTDDTKLSLQERAEYAKSVGADFLFSIHYNASENHELFGSEVWVPLEAPYNAYGYQFGCTLLTRFREMGLFIRGVKTRQGNHGDYYGILRETVALEIPAALIEHCHVDEVRDYPYCDSQEEWEAFGYEDAEAIAMFLGLSGESPGADYSGGPEDPFLQKVYALDPDKVVQSTLLDATPPEVCSIERVSEDYEGLQAAVQVTAADYDSPMMYYAYSLDGGQTYSPRQAWPGSNTLTGEYQDVFQVTLEIPEGTMPRICIRAYNQYEAYTDSNVLEGYSVFRKPQEEAQEPQQQESLAVSGEAVSGSQEPAGESLQASAGGWLNGREETEQEDAVSQSISIRNFILVSLLAALALLLLFMVLQILHSVKRFRRRHNRKR